ncbi:hypothetical protein [Mycobacterium sp.]|uniref:hypothetical protein n=1 Tax=Mycobacterium sp. TaxID=1785 RepID=UPI003D0B6C83
MPCEGPDRVERAALIALLQEWDDVDPRRRYHGWSAIAKEVARRGSALAVWNERHRSLWMTRRIWRPRCGGLALT